MSCLRLMTVLVGAVLVFAPLAVAGELRFEVRDRDGEPVPCRVHLSDSAGRPVRAPGLPFWRDHFVCNGVVNLSLASGTYRYEVERGPEHERLSGQVDVGERSALMLTLGRIADLRGESWHAGDLHVHRAPGEVRLLMQAEDIDVAPVITWWNKTNPWSAQPPPADLLTTFDGTRSFHVMAGEDEREGGALLYFGMRRPIDITAADREFPSPLTFVRAAREQQSDLWLDIEKPFWWDVPVWLAVARPDSIGLANNHMCRSQMYETEAWGRPRDAERLPAPRGNGFWTQEIYYHILNTGLRLPPSAGSASGVLPNPVGYNRVYVHTGRGYSWENWWEGLRAGRSFVTNGLLLRTRAGGKLPGHVFAKPTDGASITIDLDVRLTSLDEIRQVEVVANGEVVHALPVSGETSQHVRAQVDVPAGWFLVRAITTNPRTFRFASTAPFFVGEPGTRISRRSVDFFLTWIDERIERVSTNVTDERKRAAVLSHHDAARRFWEDRRARATAD